MLALIEKTQDIPLAMEPLYRADPAYRGPSPKIRPMFLGRDFVMSQRWVHGRRSVSPREKSIFPD